MSMGPPPKAVQDLPVGDTVKAAFNSVFGRFPELIRAALVPIAISFLLFGLQLAVRGSPAVAVLVELLLLLPYTLFAVAWHRVVLLGPAHYVYFTGIAAPAATVFETPLGSVPVDREALGAIGGLPQVVMTDEPHAPEHSLEVQIPFLQVVLGAIEIVPLVVGRARPAEVAEVLEGLWGGGETLIVVSSDLSHYLDYETARRRDAKTAAAMTQTARGPTSRSTSPTSASDSRTFST